MTAMHECTPAVCSLAGWETTSLSHPIIGWKLWSCHVIYWQHRNHVSLIMNSYVTWLCTDNRCPCPLLSIISHMTYGCLSLCNLKVINTQAARHVICVVHSRSNPVSAIQIQLNSYLRTLTVILTFYI